MNKVIMTGNLVREHSYKELKDNKIVLNNCIAVKRRGNKNEVDFINICAFTPVADLLRTYTKKGDKILVVGNLKLEKYENKDGVSMTASKVYVDEIEFLNPKKDEFEVADDQEVDNFLDDIE